MQKNKWRRKGKGGEKLNLEGEKAPGVFVLRVFKLNEDRIGLVSSFESAATSFWIFGRPCSSDSSNLGHVYSLFWASFIVSR